jgi:hypothetical protein
MHGIRRSQARLLAGIPIWIALVVLIARFVPYMPVVIIVFFGGGFFCGAIYHHLRSLNCPGCRRKFFSRTYFSGKASLTLPFARKCLWCELPLRARGPQGDPPYCPRCGESVKGIHATQCPECGNDMQEK